MSTAKPWMLSAACLPDATHSTKHKRRRICAAAPQSTGTSATILASPLSFGGKYFTGAADLSSPTGVAEFAIPGAIADLPAEDSCCPAEARSPHQGVFLPDWLCHITAEFTQEPREHDMVELFCGEAELTQAGHRARLTVASMDRNQGTIGDITTMRGLRRAVQLVMSLKPGGLLWLAPPCSSWVFLSTRSHCRAAANKWAGNQQTHQVREANMVAVLVAALIRLATVRLVQMVLEQPSDSCMHQFGPIKKALSMVAAQNVRTWLGAFSTAVTCPKPLCLYFTAGWTRALFRNKPPNKRADRSVYTVAPDGRVTGGKGLQATAAYPPEFGEAVTTLQQPSRRF
jgi:hypothetical protein